MRPQARRLMLPLLVCLWPSLALGQTQPAGTTAGEIYRKASPAVVLIELYDSKGEVSKSGSGFLVSPEGAILTNYHVVAHSKQATVRLANGDAYDTLEVLDIDKRKDIALIKIKAIGLPTLTLGRSNTVEVGDTVFSLSNPLGVLQNSLSQGIVSGIRQGDGYRYFQISAPISPGSSGGPIFNARGDVIGIAVASLQEGQNLNFAIPVDYAKGMLSSNQPRPLASIYEPEPESTKTPESKSAGGANAPVSTGAGPKPSPTPQDVFVWFDESAPGPGAPLFEVVVTAHAYDGALAMLRKARQGNTSVQAGTSVLDTGYHPATVGLDSWQKGNPNSAPSLFYWQGEEVNGATQVMHFQMTKRAYEEMLALVAGSDLRVRPSQTSNQNH